MLLTTLLRSLIYGDEGETEARDISSANRSKGDIAKSTGEG